MLGADRLPVQLMLEAATTAIAAIAALFVINIGVLHAIVSRVGGDHSDGDPGAGRQHRTIWWSPSCDAALIVYENSTGSGSAERMVSATLVRASSLPRGLIQSKTLFP
jgi:hypothetical protein